MSAVADIKGRRRILKTNLVDYLENHMVNRLANAEYAEPENEDKVFIASEEAAIRVMEPDAENVYAPMGGEPVIVRVKEGAY